MHLFLLVFIRATCKVETLLVIRSYRCSGYTSVLTPKGLIRQFCHADMELQRLKRSVDDLYHPCLKVDQAVYKHLLKECSRLKSLSNGKLIHAHIIKTDYQKDLFLQNLLIHMYGRCGDLKQARGVFESMPKKNVYSWTLMLSACNHNEHFHEALHIFKRMREEGVNPDHITLISVLKVCSNLGDLTEGKNIHESIIGGEFSFDTGVRTALIDMYAKCGNLEDAREVFETMKHRDTVSWNCIIGAYVQYGYGDHAVQLFHRMKFEGFERNSITYLLAINACSSPPNLEQGKSIHFCIMKKGMKLDVVMGNALVDMYAKCGCFPEANQIFDSLSEHNVCTWTSMIGAYAIHGYSKDAIQWFQRMQSSGVKPDKIAFVTVLGACWNSELLEAGKLIHSQIDSNGIKIEAVLGNALLSMYCRCGSLVDACEVFYKMEEKNLVSWNSLISGHVLHGHVHEALEIFSEMQRRKIRPDKVTYLSILNACASASSFSEGKFIHGLIVGSRFETDLVVTNAIIDMYGKCGSSQYASDVFFRMLCRDLVSWNAMVAAQAQDGYGKKALLLLGLMQWEDIKPDEVTFISLLSACRHSGLMEEGFFCIGLAMNNTTCH